jgi:hypothetical protein
VDVYDWYIEAAAIYPVNDPAFDINGDGVTNIQDTTIVSGNIGRPDIHTTNPPRLLSGGVAAVEGARGEGWAQAVTSAKAFTATLGSACATFHAANLTGKLQSVGMRFDIASSINLQSAELVGALANGYLNAHQEGNTVYVIAAPPEGNAPAQDMDMVKVCFNQAPGAISGAMNQVEWSGKVIVLTNHIYLPLVTQNAGQ